MTDKYEVIECHCMVRKGNNIYRLDTIIDLLNEQDERIKELNKRIKALTNEVELYRHYVEIIP